MDSSTLIWTSRAANDLQAIGDYIADYSKARATSVQIRLFEQAESLRDHPLKGHQVEDYDRDDIREYAVLNYRIFYRWDQLVVTILAIRHGRMRTPKDLDR